MARRHRATVALAQAPPRRVRAPAQVPPRRGGILGTVPANGVGGTVAHDRRRQASVGGGGGAQAVEVDVAADGRSGGGVVSRGLVVTMEAHDRRRLPNLL